MLNKNVCVIMKKVIPVLIAIFLLAACAVEETEEIVEEYPQVDQAVAVVHPTDGNVTSGIVTFTQTDEGVLVEATISGLEPESLHGFHIHEYGDCRAADGTSAGGHYDPTDMPHAAPTDEERHMGDMGNLPAGEDGIATLEYVDEKIVLSGVNSILGYAVIVHADKDDLTSQPTGDAGPRLGCGVIGVANPEL